MPLKLNVGLSKKIGQPDYGSLGASCHLEVELDQSLVSHDLDGLQERIQNVFAACRQAVSDELAQQQDASPESGLGKRNSQAVVGGHSNGSPKDHNGHRASQK